MRISSNLETSKYDQKTSNANFLKGRLAIANQYMMEMEQFTPRRSGELRVSAHVVGTGEAIRWTPVYARAQFYGTNGRAVFRNYTTPGTGKRWDEPGKTNALPKINRIAMKVMGY